MKADKTSRTAQYMALFRALESKRNNNDKLFSDPFAIHFLDRGLKLAVKASNFHLFKSYLKKTIQKRIPGAYSSGVARTKYIDDLLAFTIKDGVEQLLILGAGFDTEPHDLTSSNQFLLLKSIIRIPQSLKLTLTKNTSENYQRM